MKFFCVLGEDSKDGVVDNSEDDQQEDSSDRFLVSLRHYFSSSNHVEGHVKDQEILSVPSLREERLEADRVGSPNEIQI